MKKFKEELKWWTIWLVGSIILVAIVAGIGYLLGL